MTRRLFRVEAIVDDKILHEILSVLAEARAMNVGVFPVAAPPKSNGAHAPAEAAAPPRKAPALVRLFAANQKTPFTAADLLEVAPSGMNRAAIQQAVFQLQKGGELKRVGTGKYIRTKKLAAPTNSHTK